MQQQRIENKRHNRIIIIKRKKYINSLNHHEPKKQVQQQKKKWYQQEHHSYCTASAFNSSSPLPLDSLLPLLFPQSLIRTAPRREDAKASRGSCFFMAVAESTL